MPESEDLRVREADLDKHLTNPADATSEPAKKPADSIKAPPAEPGKDKKPVTLEPGEVVSKNDFQVNQALNLLKGLQILQNR